MVVKNMYNIILLIISCNTFYVMCDVNAVFNVTSVTTAKNKAKFSFLLTTYQGNTTGGLYNVSVLDKFTEDITVSSKRSELINAIVPTSDVHQIHQGAAEKVNTILNQVYNVSNSSIVTSVTLSSDTTNKFIGEQFDDCTDISTQKTSITQATTSVSQQKISSTQLSTFVSPQKTSTTKATTSDSTQKTSTTQAINTVSIKSSSTFYWNQTTMTPSVYHNSWCPRRCLNGQLVYISDIETKCINTRCFPCECQRPTCEIYGICCPDVTTVTYVPLNSIKVGLLSSDDIESKNISKSFPEIFQFFNKNLNQLNVEKKNKGMSKDKPLIGCDVKSSFVKFFYIHSCPEESPGNEKLMCEMDISLENLTVDWLTRVIDTSTKVVYKNIYCARCHHVEKPLKMSLEIICSSYMSVYSAVDTTSFIRQALVQNSTCVVKQGIPAEISLLTCNEKYFINNMVSTCPATYNDTDIIDHCREMNDTRYRVMFKTMVYKNLFCFICDTNSFPSITKCGTSNFVTSPPLRSPFDFLLSLSADDTDNSLEHDVITQCDITKWLSPSGTCLPMWCTEGKLLRNKNCSSFLTQVTGLEYSLHLVIISSEDREQNVSSEMTTSLILYKVEALLKAINTFFEVQVGFVFYKLSANMSQTLIWVKGITVASRNMSRDEFELDIIERLESLGEVLGANITLYSGCMFKIVGIEDLCADNVSNHDSIQCQVYRLVYSVNALNSNKHLYSDHPISITPLLTCSYVQLDRLNFTVSVDKSIFPATIIVHLNLNGLKLSLTGSNDLNKLTIDDMDMLYLCHEMLDDAIARAGLTYHLVSSVYDIILAKYVLTLICLGISMLCLGLTILTYLSFPSLRTVAGQNNVCLCLSLLLAQAFLIASSHMNTRGPICTALGVTTHFLWLWMFTWTFICSLHMFRVFTAKTRTVSSNTLVYFIRRLALSTVLPTLIVVTVIVVNYMESGSKTVGYGQKVCYLDSVFLVGIALIGPMIILVLINCTLFTFSVIQVRRVSRLKTMHVSMKEDHNEFYIYIKLSTLTGGFWFLATLAEIADQEYFRFIAIVVNGLQGLFIFLSFIANTRVLQLYRACGLRLRTMSTMYKSYSEKTEQTCT